jgi:general secretion pathway protein C
MRRYPWMINGAFLLAGSFFLAKLTNAFTYHALRELPSLETVVAQKIRDNGPGRPPPHDLTKAIVDRNLMNARREDVIPEEIGKPKFDPNAIKPCSLAQNLVSIISANQPEWSFVIFKDTKSQDTGMYAPVNGRNQIPGDITLVSVGPNEAKFRKEDHTEICVLGDDQKQPVTPTAAAPDDGEGGGAGVKKLSDTEYQVDQSEIDRILQNLNEVSTQARIVPNFVNGQSNGFKLFSIQPGSIFQKIGLTNGDVIKKINGYEMNSPDKALELYQKLRDTKSIVIQMDRHGSDKTVNYQIR